MLTELEKLIHYSFEDTTILREALTHKSYSGEHKAVRHNERLEFLGDSILGAIVANYLYTHCPHSEEGVLSKIKSNLVSRHNLYLWAKKLDLGRFMRLGHGELATGGRQRDSILSNAMEAVVGAVYLDGGYPAAEQMVLPWVRTQELTQDSGDYKSRLQEYIQKRSRSTPDYEVLQTVGPEHDKIFTVEVSLDGKRLGVGKGKNKKLAEQDAARDAYRRIKK
ncbi:MAG: ribonuclease III [Elusimicrobiaceae bacterium]|nr:ribonuclease III [Elusimicrobiaceae bacterium]MBR2505191.1 ribonuclease III [Elusimicrobiaceae bacterium]MBR5609718.1 ribonuclease III [Elusimicrobiaceae bacterium]